MADQKDIIEKTLCHLFPSRWLKRQAKETGVIQRNRKIDPVAMFWTLALGFGVKKSRDIASLRRSYEAATRTTIAASSFYDRFTPQLVAFLQRACDRAFGAISGQGQALQGALASFRDVVITDATVLRLHDLLKNRYPACRTNHTKAAAKLHLVLSVLGTSEQKVKLTGERKNDGKVWTIGQWVRNHLLLFDLGFFSYALFDRIDRLGGFFISRLKDFCNPILTAVHQGCADGLLGSNLQTVLGSIRREVLDVEVEVSFKKRQYKGKRSTAKRRFRVVGIKQPNTRIYHLYVTNIPKEILSARTIALIYSVRWLVELVFKQLKSFYHLEDFPSSNPHIVHALIYSAILTMLVSQSLEHLLRQTSDTENTTQQATGKDVFPLLRLAAVLNAYGQDLLKDVLRYAGVKPASLSLLELIRKEARDPNRKRLILPKRLEQISLVAS